jgi:outer membrane protein TolC
MTRACAIAILVAGGLAAPVGAQPTSIRLTVSDAVSRAMDASHRLAESRARKEGADATVRVRHAAGGPTATASAAYTRTNHVDEFGFPQPDGTLGIIYPDVPDNVVTRIGAQWPIYTAGRTDALERAAAAEANAVGSDLETARADLRLEATRAYWAVATAEEAVRVLEATLSRADAQVADAKARLDVGLVPPSDVLTFESQRSRDQLDLIEAVNLRESALVELRRLIGADPAAGIELADRLDAGQMFPDVTGTVPVTPENAAVSDNLISEALKQRPERQALEFRIDGAEERVRAAGAGNKPTVAVLGGFDFANPNPKIFPREQSWQSSWDVGVNLSWTLFDSGRTRAEAAEARAAVTAVEERLKDLDTIVAAEVRQRVLDLRSGLAAVRTADDGIRSAAEARRVLGERLAVGVATATDVLVAQAQLLAAELARARALANVRLSEARLQRALARP